MRLKAAETVRTIRPAGERTSGEAGHWKKDYAHVSRHGKLDNVNVTMDIKKNLHFFCFACSRLYLILEGVCSIEHHLC